MDVINTRVAALLVVGIGSSSGATAAPELDLRTITSTEICRSYDVRNGSDSGGTIALPEVPCAPLSIDDAIDQVCADGDSYEADEQRATEKAMSDLKRLLSDASDIRGTPIEMGDIAPYFGEVSITWRAGDRMLRATTFSRDVPPRLDFGSTPDGALGHYDFDAEATGEKLAEKLTWLRAVQG